MSAFLRGERVELRALARDDAPQLTRWVNDPELRPYILSARFPLATESELAWIERMQTSSSDVVFVVALRDGPPIGCAGLHDISRVDRSATFGIFVGDPAQRSRGLGTEITRLVVDYAFRTLNLHRVHLAVYASNPRAVRCYEKVGFVREGVARDGRWVDGAWVDEIQMSVLRPEWKT